MYGDRRNNDHVCGKCKWHTFENVSDGWVCVNDESDYCTEWTEYGDSCECFEERE